jgi:Na+-translocating ferredoxin:NAD+ oxidoreductase subunit B
MPETHSLADAIDALLPQAQCAQCGFDGCRPYAEAIAAGAAGINRCAPGGAKGIARLARATGRAALPLDAQYGAECPPHVVRIEEASCIGCTLCIQACPVDAILGAAKLMHTVIAPYCTGCDLCIPPCPMDCIAIVPVTREWSIADAAAARARHLARRARSAAHRARVAEGTGRIEPADQKTAIIRAAIERARRRRAGSAA